MSKMINAFATQVYPTLAGKTPNQPVTPPTPAPSSVSNMYTQPQNLASALSGNSLPSLNPTPLKQPKLNQYGVYEYEDDL